MSQTQISPSILSPGGPTWGPFGTLSAVAVTTGSLSAGIITTGTSLYTTSINPDGSNVGIGTTTPNTNLTVVGNISATGVIYGGVPSGAVMSFAMSTAPAGWVACDGSFLNNLNPLYVNLYNAIGYTFGGSGNNFKLPDMRGMFIRGTGTNGTYQTANGNYLSAGAVGTEQNDQMQGHAHSPPGGGSFDYVLNPPSGGGNTRPAGSTESAATTTSGPVSDGTNGTPRVGAETRPANISLLYCIKL